MTRAIVYIVVLAALVAAAAWIADQPGGVTVEWLGYKVQTEKVGVLIGLVALIAVMAALLYRLWVALRRTPRAIAAHGEAGRREKGYKALTQGLVAAAAGDAAEARRLAKRADHLLDDPSLTRLLSAQAAQLGGDEAGARESFTAMLENPDTEFLGLRGLLSQARRSGDKAAALAYAERARRLRPKTDWVLTTLFDLQAENRDWARALDTLDDAIRYNAMEAEDGRRRKLAVLLGCAADAERGGSRQQSLAFARKAYALSPEHLPAVLAMARLLTAGGKNRAAARIAEAAWRPRPHRELARLYAGMAGDDKPIARLRRLERLAQHNPDHSETHIALAEAAMAAALWGVARNHLNRALAAMKDSATAGVYRMLAGLEEAERGDGAAARDWLMRAAAADPDPAWVCTECGSAWEAWTPTCGKCGALGSLDWQSPPHAHRALLAAPGAPRPASGPAFRAASPASPPHLPARSPGASPVPPPPPPPDIAGPRRPETPSSATPRAEPPRPGAPGPDSPRPGAQDREAAPPPEPENRADPDRPVAAEDLSDEDRPGPPPLTRLTRGAN